MSALAFVWCSFYLLQRGYVDERKLKRPAAAMEKANSRSKASSPREKTTTEKRRAYG